MSTLIALMLFTLSGQPGDEPGTTRSPIRPVIEPFGYRGVRLDDGPLRRQVELGARRLPANPQ